MRKEDIDPTDASPRIVILPWLPLDEPATFADVIILPRKAAVAHARAFAGEDLSEHVRHATSYFGSGFRYANSFDTLKPTDDDMRPQMVEPSVIFLEPPLTLKRIDDVLAAVGFSCMVRNGSGGDTNGVVFERYVQSLGKRPEFIIPMSRQMSGSKTTGTEAINLIVTRPHRCGEFRTPDEAYWEAVARALDDAAGSRVVAALRALVAATQDIETIPETLERSLYAIALERLLALGKTERDVLRKQIVTERVAAGMSVQNAEKISASTMQSARARQLLRPLLGPEVLGIQSGYHIANVLRAIRLERNETVHPEGRPAGLYAFEKQRTVRLNLIWFRAAQALVTASLVEAGLAGPDGRLALAVMAIEAWLGTLREGDPRTSEVASATNAWWSTAMICCKSLLMNRDSGRWRDYFNDIGKFTIPKREPVVAIRKLIPIS
jgi:hypothetical protein